MNFPYNIIPRWLKSGKISKKGEIFVALDIGTAWVKAIAFSYSSSENGKIANIVGVGRVKQKKGNMNAGIVADIEGVLAASREAISRASENAEPKAMILGIGGVGVQGITTSFSIKREVPGIELSEEEFSNLLHKVQWKALERIKREIPSETGHEDIEIRLVDAQILNINIDGYEISNPLGFKGKEIEIGIFNAYAPLVHLGAIETIAQRLNLNLLRVVVEPYAVARTVGRDFMDAPSKESREVLESNAVFLDIGGGTTDIAVVRNGSLLGTKVLSFGGRNFTKRLSDFLGVGEEDGEVIKLKYSAGRLSNNVNKKIKEKLERDILIWRKGVTLALKDFSEGITLPAKVMICGGGSMLPGIKEALKEDAWLSQLDFIRAPSVKILTPEDIIGIQDKSMVLKSVQDVTPTSLVSVALLLSQEDEIISKALKRVMRLTQTT